MKSRIPTLVPCVLLAFWGGAMGATWYVDDSVTSSGDGTTWQTAFKTIQQGIDSASHGDTVLVAQGTYVENIQFNGKNIILTSTDPLDPVVVAKTIIDGNQSGPVVSFSGGEDESCTLSGFTIRNGSAEIGSGILGGTWEKETRASIRDNVVSANTSRYHAVAFCGGTIESNIISDNSGNGLRYCNGTVRKNIISGNSGSGLYSCDGMVEGNTISANAGAGLEQCHGTVQRNTISGNSQRGLDGCNGIIRSNVITGNLWGGLLDCNGTIENNTIHGNPAWGLNGCRGTIRNCIVWGNWPLPGAAQIWGCSEPTYCCIQDWPGGGAGNIPFNPHFVDAENGDFHLRSWSPCVDAGDPFSAFSEEPQPNGARVNMGAYGNTSEAASGSPDTDDDGLPDEWELYWFGDLQENSAGDADSDCIPNLTEYHYARNPNSAAEPRTCNVTKETWHVSIHEALSGSDDGDEIVVYPGLYLENISFDAKNVILRSTNPSDESIVAGTIIQAASEMFSVVTFDGTEDETCVLSGFTIRNGGGWDGGGICGGSQSVHTHATIRNNIICGNSVPRHGRGGGVAHCDGLIENNLIAENSASRPFDGGGGLASCNGTIRNNKITKNTGGVGGGLVSCDGTIEGNLIFENAADEGAGVAYCSGRITNNVIRGNCSEWSGGGLYYCFGTIENNTIVGNSARYGGGLYDCEATIRNCIVWGNSATTHSPQIAISSEPTYSCIQDWNGAGEGNIRVAPYFVDAEAGDFHLLSWSPCIDAGDPASPYANESQPNGGRVNMGAYGNTPEATCKSPDTDADDLPDDWELHFFGHLQADGSSDPDGDGILCIIEYRYAWDPTHKAETFVQNLRSGIAYQSIQSTLWESADGDEIVVARGTYRENVFLAGKNVLLRSTDPSDETVVASTMIDGGRNGPVVRFSGSEEETCVLAGFTITNGVGPYAGGIIGGNTIQDTHATIRNNVITGNLSLEDGGGVSRCDGTIRDNVIFDNQASYSGGGVSHCDGLTEGNVITGNSANCGGGVANCRGTLRNNLIEGNAAVGEDALGGGLYDCEGTVEDNIIIGNSARLGGGLCDCTNGVIKGNTIRENSAESGGGLHSCSGKLQDNEIAWNSASTFGGALCSCSALTDGNIIADNRADRGGGLHDCSLILRNNVIIRNRAESSGGGLHACHGFFQNNTVAYNSAQRGGGLFDFSGGVQNGIVWGNQAEYGAQLETSAEPTHSCIQDWTGAGEGNIAEEPRFVDAENDNFRLLPDSPCIDTGNNEATYLSEIDILGMHRIMFGGKSLTVDMGAYEFCINKLEPVPGTDEAIFTWSSLEGKTYSIFYTDDLFNWQTAIADFPSSGNQTTSWTDDGSLTGVPPLLAPKRFYRILENP